MHGAFYLNTVLLLIPVTVGGEEKQLHYLHDLSVLGLFMTFSLWGHCLVHVESFVLSEGARDEVVRFFQRQDTKETNCEERENLGWLLLKSLLLLTADSSVSDHLK